jgi:integrase
MIKELNILRRLGLPDLFKGLRPKGEVDKEPTPYETKFIQNRLLADGALDGLNEDARYIIYVIADTGLRPSEVVNLNSKTIHLKAKIPHVSVLPDGRRLKRRQFAGSSARWCCAGGPESEARGLPAVS